MAKQRKLICSVCDQTLEDRHCKHCGTDMPSQSVWPPPPKQLTDSVLEDEMNILPWQDDFPLGLGLGAVFYIALTILLWVEGFELLKKTFGGTHDAVQHLVFFGMVLFPALPAALMALIPATKGRKFSHGMLADSGIGLILLCLVVAMFLG